MMQSSAILCPPKTTYKRLEDVERDRPLPLGRDRSRGGRSGHFLSLGLCLGGDIALRLEVSDDVGRRVLIGIL